MNSAVKTIYRAVFYGHNLAQAEYQETCKVEINTTMPSVDSFDWGSRFTSFEDGPVKVVVISR